MKVIGYTRVSTDEQGEHGASLDAQEEAIRDEASRRGWTVEVRREVASGTRAANRPVLQETLAELLRGDVLLATKLDRVTRSLVDFAGLVEQAQRRGWKLIVLQDGFDLTTPTGRAMAGMLAVFAQFEREMIAQRTREGLRRKGRGIPVERRREILRLAEDGASQRKIAARLGMHKEAVARVLRSASAV